MSSLMPSDVPVAWGIFWGERPSGWVVTVVVHDAGVWTGGAEYEGEARYYDDRELFDDEQGGQVVPFGRAGQLGYHIATVHARTFRDAQTIGEYFRQDIPVIIDLHGLDDAGAKRIVDFASGLIFGRRGDIERLASRMFLILPPRFGVLRERAAFNDEGFYNQV
jgi:cell division inhibitor SepF